MLPPPLLSEKEVRGPLRQQGDGECPPGVGWGDLGLQFVKPSFQSPSVSRKTRKPRICRFALSDVGGAGDFAPAAWKQDKVSGTSSVFLAQ